MKNIRAIVTLHYFSAASLPMSAAGLPTQKLQSHFTKTQEAKSRLAGKAGNTI